jgi:uncharacterized repeat protein (TIGR01451 family)
LYARFNCFDLDKEDNDMIRRLLHWKRPHRAALTVIGALAATGVVASVALALISDTGTHSVIVPNSGQSKTADLGNATVEYIGSSASNQASGTGLFDPFLRLQGDPTEKGFNTDGAVQFQTKSGKWTKAILASAIPVVDCGGDQAGSNCWELFVDINESNTAKYVSLTKVEIYFANSATLTDYPFSASEATLQYEFNGEIQIHDVNQGSGRGDLRYLVPVQPFDSGDWFVLYSEWGSSTAAPDGKTFASEGGFEEWKVRKAPNLTIVKTADAASVNAGSNIGFTITMTNGGAADATGVTISDPLPSGTGVDWSIASQNPAGSCSISGSPPTETLNCGPLTLASGGGQLTVHITSATTGDSCGLYDNTATFTSTNAGTGSDDASVTVSCGAIRILKNSTKGGAVANAGAVFAVDGPDADTTADFSVTDASPAAGLDEDGDIGEVCVSGLVPGATYTVNETSPPSGYGGASESDVTVVGVAGNCSTAGLSSATFSNAPLADLLVQVDGQSSGEIASSIDCVDSGNTSIGSAGIPDPKVDPAVVDVDDLEPDTYTCTITIDP